MSKSLGDVVLSFSPLQVAEYLVEKGHLQPLTNPVNQALQAHSLDLSLPITSFCYRDSEKKSRKVYRHVHLRIVSMPVSCGVYANG